MRKSWAAGICLAAPLGPRVAEACGSCLSAVDGTREAYYGTTALMMLLPFVAIGAIAWWLRRAARSARQQRGPAAPDVP